MNEFINNSPYLTTFMVCFVAGCQVVLVDNMYANLTRFRISKLKVSK